MNVILLSDWVLADIIKLYWIRVGSNPMICIFIRGEKSGHIQRPKETTRDSGGTD